MSAETSRINVNKLDGYNRLKLPVWESQSKFEEYASPILGTTILMGGSWKTWNGSKFVGV